MKLRGLFQRQPKPALRITERTTISLIIEDEWYVLDILKEEGTAVNTFDVYVEKLLPNGGYQQLASSSCEGACFDVCNGDTLLAYWSEVVERYHEFSKRAV